jgi:DNA-directed RNA polymerase specialized sigma24 family protein
MSEEHATAMVQRYVNDLAQRLDCQPAAAALREELVPSPARSVAGLTADGLLMLRAIDELFEDQWKVFDLVGIQGLTQVEAAELLVVRAVTVKRRSSRDVWLLTDQLAELRPGGKPPDAI